ncbi:MAG: hypothetical protein IPJ74_02305 [Saprospiraceae bacterium]|nr:hypothetical protein [Saprospiraceae bacterium]
MNWNQIAILLETLSFFLVVPELFGERRLQKFQKILSKRLHEIRSKKPHEIVPKKFITPLVLIIIIIIVSLIILCILLRLEERRQSESNPNQYLGIAIILGIILLFAGLVMIPFLYFIPLWILYIILIFLLWLLKRFKAKGILFGLGTTLFLISKIISFRQG